MEPLSQQTPVPLKCETCGSDKTKARVIWLNPEDGQIYPKVSLVELITVVVLMGLSLFWLIMTVVYHLNPFLLVLSAVLFSTLITVSLAEGLRFIARKKFEETWFYTCKSCGTQWLAPYDPDSPPPD
jgi:hypothetical protein